MSDDQIYATRFALMSQEIASLKTDVERLNRDVKSAREVATEKGKQYAQADAKSAEMRPLVEYIYESKDVPLALSMKAKEVLQGNPSPLLDRLEKAEADAIYGKALSKELGQKCDALIAQNEKLQRDVEYHKSAAEAASKIMHQIDSAWKADKAQLEKLERVWDEVSSLYAIDWEVYRNSPEDVRRNAAERWVKGGGFELAEALAACPKEGK